MKNSRIISITEFFSNITRFYQDHFTLLWKVMMPLIIFCFLIDVGILIYYYNIAVEPTWTVETSDGFSVTNLLTTDGKKVNRSLGFSSFIIIFLWFAMCPLALTVFRLRLGMNVSFQDVWRHTLRRTLSIISASLLLVVLFLFLVLLVLLISSFIALSINFLPIHILTLLVTVVVIIYVAVRWSLINQCLIIENLSVIQAFRRSYELVKDRDVSFFVRYLLLLWGSGVFTSLVFALTFLMLSTLAPELQPMQEKLLSVEAYNLLAGIDISWQYKDFVIDIGNIEAVLSMMPKFWVITVILIVKIILFAVFTPVWAILTTDNYLEQTGSESNSGENLENSITD